MKNKASSLLTTLFLIAAAGGVGCAAQEEVNIDQVTSAVTADQGLSPGPCGGTSLVAVVGTVGYGEMGAVGCAGDTPYEMECASGLTPHNVDSRPGKNYAPSAPGWFSCWGNSPDVVCYSQPLINGYVNVRRNYQGIDYGCHGGS